MNRKGLMTYYDSKFPVVVQPILSGDFVNGLRAVYEARFSDPIREYGRLWFLDKDFKVKNEWSSYLRFRWLTKIEGLFYNETL